MCQGLSHFFLFFLPNFVLTELATSSIQFKLEKRSVEEVYLVASAGEKIGVTGNHVL